MTMRDFGVLMMLVGALTFVIIMAISVFRESVMFGIAFVAALTAATGIYVAHHDD